MKTSLTKARIIETLRPGDVILIRYRCPNLIQAGIADFSGADVSHAVCSLGGLDIVEADVVGVVRTNLYNYLKGDCDLTVRRVRPQLSYEEKDAIGRYWLKCVGEHYDFGMIVGLGLLFLIRKMLHPLIPPLGEYLFKHLRNVFAHKNQTTCFELWVRGVRQKRAKFLSAYADAKVSPALGLRDRDLETAAEWPAATLVRG